MASRAAPPAPAPPPHSSSRHAAVMNRTTMAPDVSELELMRTILGEDVPQATILACLNACAFDVTAALNWYFMEMASQAEEEAARVAAEAAAATDNDDSNSVPIIQSGHSLTLHARYLPGMISKTDTYYATLTHGVPSYDMVTANNERFVSIRLRKRGWPGGHLFGSRASSLSSSLFSLVSSSGVTSSPPLGPQHLVEPTPHAATSVQRTYIMNGDIVTLECNGLWLKAGSLHKVLQWKSPSDDDRCKFVVRGLPLGRSLRPGDYFFLTSYKWEDKELVLKDEKPVGLTSYNTSVHRFFLGLDRVKYPTDRLYFYAKMTESAMSSLPRPSDPIDLRHVTISVAQPPVRYDAPPDVMVVPRRKESISEEIHLIDAKIDQMVDIVGPDVSRDRLATFLDGAGGNVQVALEHYFMTITALEAKAAEELRQSTLHSTTATFGSSQQQDDDRTLSALTHLEISGSHHPHRRPLSELIIPIPSMAGEPVRSPVFEAMNEPTAGSHNDVYSAVNAALEDSILLSSSRSRRGTSGDSTTLESSFYAPETDVYGVESGREGLTIHDFEMVSVLGKGSFGAVMLVRFKKDGRVFALKIIKKGNMDKADIRNAMEERQILQRIHHPYICSLVFAFQTNERLYLGMKYYAAGDLFYHLNMRGRLPLRDAQLYAAELVLAISYLHELNILYRDLKPSNIMIDSDGHIGVVDFGLSKQHIYGSSHGVKTLSGTAEYVAPEALAQMEDGSRSYGKAYDWWSLGIVLYEMLAGESPFYDRNEHKMLRKIAYADVVFPDDFPREAVGLVRGLLCKDPSQRLGSERMGGVAAIRRDRFFHGMDWEKLARREIAAYWTPKLSSETDTRYVDPEFIDDGPPSAVHDPSVDAATSESKRFSQFSFNINLT
ncbi:hypothetical protein ATCC90586_003555 [Pythium insidiosum]|nr:hypothetical protein ATCC90586_003555 [Pythium insidiosum]